MDLFWAFQCRDVQYLEVRAEICVVWLRNSLRLLHTDNMRWIITDDIHHVASSIRFVLRALATLTFDMIRGVIA